MKWGVMMVQTISPWVSQNWWRLRFTALTLLPKWKQPDATRRLTSLLLDHRVNQKCGRLSRFLSVRLSPPVIRDEVAYLAHVWPGRRSHPQPVATRMSLLQVQCGLIKVLKRTRQLDPSSTLDPYPKRPQTLSRRVAA